jgi:hypothetical protein
MKDRWLFSWWVGFASAYGGGHTTAFLYALLTGKKAEPRLFSTAMGNNIFLIYTVCWYLMLYTPAFKYVKNRLYTVALIFTAILSIDTVTSRTEWARFELGNTIPVILVFGTLGGCGGTLWAEFLSSLSGDRVGRTQLAVPGKSVWKAILTALFHYGMLHLGYLNKRESTALIYTATALFIVLHSEGIVKKHWTEPITELFYSITRLPGGPKKEKKAAAAAATPSRATSPKSPRSRATTPSRKKRN